MKRRVVLAGVIVVVAALVAAVTMFWKQSSGVLVLDQRGIEKAAAVEVAKNVLETDDHGIKAVVWIFTLEDTSTLVTAAELRLPEGCRLIETNSVGQGLDIAQRLFQQPDFDTDGKYLLFMPTAMPTVIDQMFMERLLFPGVEVMIIAPTETDTKQS